MSSVNQSELSLTVVSNISMSVLYRQSTNLDKTITTILQLSNVLLRQCRQSTNLDKANTTALCLSIVILTQYRQSTDLDKAIVMASCSSSTRQLTMLEQEMAYTVETNECEQAKWTV